MLLKLIALTHLYLNGNMISDCGTGSLSEGIEVNTALIYLDSMPY